MEKLSELRRRLDVAVNELNSDAVIADAELYAEKENEIAGIELMIERAIKANERAASLSKPVEAKIEARETESSTDWSPSAKSFNLRGLESLSPGHFSTGIQRQFDHYLRQARANIGFKPTERTFASFGEQLQAVFSAAMATRSGRTPPYSSTKTPLTELTPRSRTLAGLTYS